MHRNELSIRNEFCGPQYVRKRRRWGSMQREIELGWSPRSRVSHVGRWSKRYHIPQFDRRGPKAAAKPVRRPRPEQLVAGLQELELRVDPDSAGTRLGATPQTEFGTNILSLFFTTPDEYFDSTNRTERIKSIGQNARCRSGIAFVGRCRALRH